MAGIPIYAIWGEQQQQKKTKQKQLTVFTVQFLWSVYNRIYVEYLLLSNMANRILLFCFK